MALLDGKADRRAEGRGEVGMNDLRPCPFCGGEVSITYLSADNVFAVWHKNDGCKFIEPMYIDGEYAKSLSDAQNIWNNRAVKRE